MKKFLLVLLSVVFIVGCGDEEAPKEIEVESEEVSEELKGGE